MLHNPDKGNPNDWSIEGWSAEWRRIGPEWFQYRIIDPDTSVRTTGDKGGWVDYKNPFYQNLMNHIKRETQHLASLDARKVAEIYQVEFGKIHTENF